MSLGWSLLSFVVGWFGHKVVHAWWFRYRVMRRRSAVHVLRRRR